MNPSTIDEKSGVGAGERRATRQFEQVGAVERGGKNAGRDGDGR
jgi:hypothetical protein